MNLTEKMGQKPDMKEFFLALLGFELKAFAKKLLYYLSHAHRPFCFCYFSYRVSHLFCPGLVLDCDPPFYIPCIAGMASTYHDTQFYWLMWG
jgi:hypothetical protein